jgi:hypothetical protein
MVVHWWKIREQGWVSAIAVNAVGAVVCFFVFALILVTKFIHGAWAVAVIVPALIFLFLGIRNHYRMAVESAAATQEDIEAAGKKMIEPRNHVIILAKCLDKRLLGSIRFAKLIKAETTRALHVDANGCGGDFKKQFESANLGIELEVVESPYRETIPVVVDYIRQFKRKPDDTITVVISELSPDDAIDLALHSHVFTILKTLLFAEPNVVVVSVPLRFED